MNRTPEALRIGGELAAMLGQTPDPSAPRTVRVPSRKTPGVFYDVVIGLDGAMQCNCPASFNRLDCWHLKFVREEMNMTTETSRALVPVVMQPEVALLPTERELNLIDRAAAMVWAGAVSIPKELNTQAKVAAVMLYGLELGLRPMTAIQHLYIVEGKVAASAQVMAGMCMSKEPDIRFLVKELTDQVCTMRFVRPSRGVDETMTITWEQIKRAGLARGANLQYPEDRLRYHCTKRLCRTYAPDLINNLDDGVVVPGVGGAQEWRVEDEDELYNEGDGPQPRLAQDNPQQGEDAGVDNIPLATDEQLAKVTEWTEAIKAKPDAKTVTDAVDAARRAEYPYAVVNGRFSAAKLTEQHCAEYIAILADAAGGAAEAVQQPSMV